jgi:hypothetical protein
MQAKSSLGLASAILSTLCYQWKASSQAYRRVDILLGFLSETKECRLADLEVL